MIIFTVYGQPKPQGSTQVVPIRKKGGGYLAREDGRPVLRPIHKDGAALKSWRQEVAIAAREAYAGDIMTGAIHLEITIERPRPKNHYGAGRNAARLKPSAPGRPTTRPDTLKLVRSIEDALTGVLWRDDAQIVTHVLTKVWGDSHRVTVRVYEEDRHDYDPTRDPLEGLKAEADAARSELKKLRDKTTVTELFDAHSNRWIVPAEICIAAELMPDDVLCILEGPEFESLDEPGGKRDFTYRRYRRRLPPFLKAKNEDHK